MLIDPTMTVQANEDAVAVLREKDMLGGWADAIEPYLGDIIRKLPVFETDAEQKLEKFRHALQVNSQF